MKAVCISCFNYYDNRLKHVEQHLKRKGYDVLYITSDFDHIDKIRYRIDRPNTIQIRVNAYSKNLSIQRLFSHYLFAKKTLREINRIKPDLLYVMLPPNYLAKFISKYKNTNDVKIIYDLYDLWPETFPSDKAKLLLSLPFKLWRQLRDNNLNSADVIVTECELYQEKLKCILNGANKEVLYLTKEKSEIVSTPNIDINTINISYLGSINSIIDIPLIVKLLTAINKLKPVILHIIGDGENREQLIHEANESGIRVEYYGRIYNEEKKRAIFDSCLFGINMMKDSVCVGLTMKSIDYFQAGLPILNNIQADTANLIEKHSIGINVTKDNIEDVAANVVALERSDILLMRENTKKVFESLFSHEAFNIKLEKVFQRIY
ncbi:hypothetical protein QW71_09515 [Paenibacillus sp. IHB B 3415]|uniref:glycosyltransferase n=1 Tax=Paenibacillus sp. IHB B 3415 TaxID=867080 RepID=UPI000574D62D|nr:glycosyltransferase [Paenibacillus sp. IHB B 3415]KHL95999.1 hypothetical protein QW71_09515 [Paenibacillus sp. IHB B 3415]